MPERVRAAVGTLDLLVSHSVFEHILRPSRAIVILNQILKPGGVLVWSVPWVTVHHGGDKYADFRRFSTAGARRLLSCAGFKVRQLWGGGNFLSNLAFLSHTSPNEIDDADLFARCNGRKRMGCGRRHYMATMAVGVKVREVSSEEIVRNCSAAEGDATPVAATRTSSWRSASFATFFRDLLLLRGRARIFE